MLLIWNALREHCALLQKQRTHQIWYSKSIQSVIIKFAYQIRNIWATTRPNEPCIVATFKLLFNIYRCWLQIIKYTNAAILRYKYILAMNNGFSTVSTEITHELVRPAICAQITALIKISTSLCRKCWSSKILIWRFENDIIHVELSEISTLHAVVKAFSHSFFYCSTHCCVLRDAKQIDGLTHLHISTTNT